jgi:acyl-CoA synthetase (AMP-forming)/AMP-acid ligase II
MLRSTVTGAWASCSCTPNERKDPAVSFLLAAVAHCEALGTKIKRLIAVTGLSITAMQNLARPWDIEDLYQAVPPADQWQGRAWMHTCPRGRAQPRLEYSAERNAWLPAFVQGPGVFDGYWRQPAATAAAFIDFQGRSFFRTGDLGRQDADGYFYITDRLKRMINASGFKVWPAEVEMLMFKNPGIQAACVVASRDDYRGESIKAVVVSKPSHVGLNELQIIDWCRGHMAAYKVPRVIQFAESLPKSASGKVMWRLLQDAA